MTQPEGGSLPSPISQPLTHCPRCGSARLQAVVESEVQDVHFLCRACGRCWDIAFGTAQRVDPASCYGCPERGRCEETFAVDHTGTSHRSVAG